MNARGAVSFDDEFVSELAERIAERLRSPNDNVVDGFIDVGGAAAFLACPTSRIYALVSARRIPHHRDGSRLLFGAALTARPRSQEVESMAQSDTRTLEKTKTPGVYRRHAAGCGRRGRCSCPYVVRWKERGSARKQMFATYELAREFKAGWTRVLARGSRCRRRRSPITSRNGS